MHMETLTKSCSPTKVIFRQWRSANAWKGNCVRQRIEKIFDNELENTSAALTLGKLREKKDILMNASTVKNPISLKMGFGYNATLRISFFSWIQTCQRVRLPVLIIQLQRHLPTGEVLYYVFLKSSFFTNDIINSWWNSRTKDRTEGDPSPVPVSISNVDDRKGQPFVDLVNEKFPKTKVKQDRTGRLVVCWLKSRKFRNPGVAGKIQEILVDDEVPERKNSHSSFSHEAFLEPTFKRREDLGKHSVHTHFPKDKNCKICQRSEIRRALCRKRNGEAVPRAENFEDLITAGHKVSVKILNLKKKSDVLLVNTTPKMQWEYSEKHMWKNGHGKKVGWTTTVRELGRQSVQQHAERKAR